MTKKRFDIQFDTVRYFLVVDVPNERCVGRFDTMADAKGYLELYEFYIELQEENEQLKQYKQTVSDVLMDWSVKNLSANEFIIVHSIMKELNVGDVE